MQSAQIIYFLAQITRNGIHKHFREIKYLKTNQYHNNTYPKYRMQT